MNIPTFFKYIAVFCISFLIIGCDEPLEFEDPNLGDEKMILVLADIHLAEAQITQLSTLTPPQRDSVGSKLYLTIFKLHSISQQDFEQSMNAYMKNPEALSKIYEKVLEKLQKDEAIHGKR